MIILGARSRPARLLGALLLGGALLTACGGGDDPVADAPAQTLASPAAAPKGYRLEKVVDHGFSIAVPKQWLQIPLDPAKMRAVLKSNPQLPLDPDKPLPYNFLAYAKDGSAANVNVIATQSGGADLAAVQAGYADQLKSLKPTGVGVERVQTPVGEMLRGTYTITVNNADGVPITTKAVQYILIRDNSLFIATITQAAPNVSAKLADAIGRSLYPL